MRTRLPALLLSLLAVFTATTAHAHSEPWIPGTSSTHVGAFTGVTPQNRIGGYQLASWLSEADLQLQLGGSTKANWLSITAHASGSGLFQQRDPMGFADSVNLYAGFAWDPVNNRDPTGASVWTAVEGFASEYWNQASAIIAMQMRGGMAVGGAVTAAEAAFDAFSSELDESGDIGQSLLAGANANNPVFHALVEGSEDYSTLKDGTLDEADRVKGKWLLRATQALVAGRLVGGAKRGSGATEATARRERILTGGPADEVAGPQRIVEQPLASPKPHGNSINNGRPSHRYVIVEEADSSLHKTGVSSGKLNKNGSSRRANRQVNKLNKQAGYKKYKAVVVEKDLPRSTVLENEQDVVNKYFERHGEMPPGMERPTPK